MINNANNNAQMSTRRTVQLAVIISGISFVAWVGLAVVIWAILRARGILFDFWAMLEAVSTAAAVAQFLGGGVVALWQLRESVDTRNLDIFNAIFEKLMSDRDIEARRWIYINLPDLPEQGLSSLEPEGQAHVKRVLNSLDHLGFLMQQNWITPEAEEAVIQWVSPFVVKVWAKLGPYIDFEARRRKEPDYYEAVRELAQRCIVWRKQHMPEAEITWVKDAL